jgi:hypothetical protein
MKRSQVSQLIVVIAGCTALAATAHADPIVNTIAFTETLLVGSDTVETLAGATLFTITGAGYSDSLSPVIAADFASNAPCNFCYSVLVGSPLPIQIQSTAFLIPQLSEYAFLTELTPDYVVVRSAGPAIAFSGGAADSPTDFINALVTAGGPGYSIVGAPSASSIGNWSFDTGGFAPDGSLLEGTVTFDVFELDIVEQPVAATPEPSPIALLASGLLLILLFARRKAAGA